MPGAADAPPKYVVERLLAEGAEGRVYLVRDGDLRRRVAMKVIQSDGVDDPRRLKRFLNEARRTSALRHSGVPAVHDLGYSADGELYFTMRLVDGRTLRDVILGLDAGDPEVVEEWSLVRLVQALQQAANTVHHAHSRGLVHRDLKPDNIAVGEFQETLVLDWGLAKRVGEDEEAGGEPITGEVDKTLFGAIKGTPLYMAPEQARGRICDIDAQTDVFSLGAMLYEILCLRPPYKGTAMDEVVEQAREATIVPPRERNPGREMPRVLVETAMRALSPRKSDRHPSARAFAEDLQAFLEGTKERALRVEEARALLDEAIEAAGRSGELAAEAARLATTARDLRRALPPWSSDEAMRPLWEMEDRTERVRLGGAEAYARALDLASRSLSNDPDNADARELMAWLHYERFAEAERTGNQVEATWLRRRLDQYNDGALDELLDSAGACLVVTEPEGALVTATRYVQRARRLVEQDARTLGVAPVACGAIGIGSFLLRANRDGCAEARIPLLLRRGDELAVSVRLLDADEVPAGFLWVPAGTFLSGAKAELAPAFVEDYLIGEHPVLLSDYALWLDELHAADPDAVAQHLPWTDSHGPLLRRVNGRHRFCPASPLSVQPIEHHERLPVVGVTHDSAAAYAAWVGDEVGLRVRLPSEAEWEKAARGCDGRLYPWGDAFEATFCSMMESTREDANLRPVGAFPADVSPYGVRDLAGGVREWCSDDVAAGRHVGVCRGGAWYLPGRDCTAVTRWLVERSSKNPGIGFRLAADVRWRD